MQHAVPACTLSQSISSISKTRIKIASYFLESLDSGGVGEEGFPLLYLSLRALTTTRVNEIKVQ